MFEVSLRYLGDAFPQSGNHEPKVMFKGQLFNYGAVYELLGQIRMLFTQTLQ